MVACVVVGCNNFNSLTKDSSIQYYPFPKASSIFYQKWVEACGWPSGSTVSETARICSIHFEEKVFYEELTLVDRVASYVRRLKYNAEPTLYLPETQIIIKENTLELENIKVIYDIDAAEETNEIAASSVQNNSTIKEETPMECENVHDKYGYIKSNMDLHQAQVRNEKFKQNIDCLEVELESLEKTLEKKKKVYLAHEDGKKLSNKNSSRPLDQITLLSKVFSESQIKILFGKKKTYWSNDDMAVGYTIRHLSNKKCYTYLTKTLNIPLPGLSSIERWVTSKGNKETDDDATCRDLERGDTKHLYTNTADEQWMTMKEDDMLENINDTTQVLRSDS